MKQFYGSKGQAALEYLVTYGWAFIVIIAAVSLLAYFGLINPSRYVPESCEFGEQLSCLDQYVDNASIIQLRLKNNFEEDIDVVNADGQYIVWHGDPSGSAGTDVTIASGEIARVQLLSFNKSLFPGDKERYEATLIFQRSGGSIKHNISGSFYTEVSDSSLGLLN